MAYHPVLPTPRICAHCNTHFVAKDKRRIYCSSSCNTLAWLARQPQKKQAVSKASSQEKDLAFSFQNIATMAAGSTIASGVNYVFNDAPFYEALSKRLSTMEHHLGREAGKTDTMNKKLNQFIRAVRIALPDVHTQLRLLEISDSQKRLG